MPDRSTAPTSGNGMSAPPAAAGSRCWYALTLAVEGTYSNTKPPAGLTIIDSTRPSPSCFALTAMPPDAYGLPRLPVPLVCRLLPSDVRKSPGMLIVEAIQSLLLGTDERRAADCPALAAPKRD